ncbi:MAG: hypothetical protein E7426_07920 [Ruminococcaceae bacterium]|nr:hypothetical protein [Oscillospiraceae bacterium]
MKRISTILLGLVLCLGLFLTLPTAEAAGDVTVNAANFPDANFRSYVSANCDANGNGVLSATEITAVKTINVANKDIGSLTGVEYFTALTYLNCSGNWLMELNVDQHSDLNWLDVSNNTDLTELSCRLCALTKLNVTGCPALETLNFDYNQLTALDVSGCTALETLYCYNNLLTALDVSANAALKTLYCENNRFAVLDIGASPNLVNAYLNGMRYNGETYYEYIKDGDALCVDKTTEVLSETPVPVITT